MNDLKRILSVIICVLMITVSVPVSAFAVDDDGKIDLYKVFSNENDIMKTEVGSRVYKWSMHLPDDGIIYKSDRANFFNMSTASYNSNIQLEVNKNEDKLTLEEMLYKMQNSSRMNNYWIWGDKEYYVDIAQDASGQRYIKVIKTNTFYDYYLVDKAAQEFSDYIENRIYIANDYIYNLTVDMNGEFYRQHEDMFAKLVNSFKLSFDLSNPNIKELSDSVSTTREYKNTSYGWKITMSPYWRLNNTPNSRNQTFSPVYTDEELNIEGTKENDDNEIKIQEGVTVSLVSSIASGDTASAWAGQEIQMLKNNYNSDVYEILKNENVSRNRMDIHHVAIRYKNITKNPYIVDNLYVLGNGYKYLVSATIKEEKYQDSSKRSGFDTMLNSFTLDSSCLSKYIGKIVAAESLMDIRSPKELKTKKYDFSTKVTKSWDVFSNNSYYYNGYVNRVYMDKMTMGSMYMERVSNNEFVYAYEPMSGISINMSAGLNANDIHQVVSDNVQRYLKDSDIGVGLAKVKIQSAENNGAVIYKIEKEYDIGAIYNFVNSDSTKIYDLEQLQNEYMYIVKTGKDIYMENITLPVAKITDNNKQKINNIWANTTINKINYSASSNNWVEHKLDEFDNTKKQPLPF